MTLLSTMKKINPLYYFLVLTFVFAMVAIGVFVSGYGSASREYFANDDGKLIMYYADWCGHCKTTKPIFKKLGNSQRVNGKKISIQMVNADEEPDKVKAAGVKGFPTIHLVHKNGRKKEFQGKRTVAGFKNFLKENVKSK